MTIKSLFEKVDAKLASQPEEQVLLQKYDAEIGDMALTCYKVANSISLADPRSMGISGIAPSVGDLGKSISMGLSGPYSGPSGTAKWIEIIKNMLAPAKDFVTKDRVGQSIGLGLGGAALGGAAGALVDSKSPYETEEDFKKRRLNSALTGGIAGGAIGGSLPTILAAITPKANPAVTESGTTNPPESVAEHAGQVIGSAAATPSVMAPVAGAGIGLGVNRWARSNDAANLSSSVSKFDVAHKTMMDVQNDIVKRQSELNKILSKYQGTGKAMPPSIRNDAQYLHELIRGDKAKIPGYQSAVAEAERELRKASNSHIHFGATISKIKNPIVRGILQRLGSKKLSSGGLGAVALPVLLNLLHLNTEVLNQELDVGQPAQ